MPTHVGFYFKMLGKVKIILEFRLTFFLPVSLSKDTRTWKETKGESCQRDGKELNSANKENWKQILAKLSTNSIPCLARVDLVALPSKLNLTPSFVLIETLT